MCAYLLLRWRLSEHSHDSAELLGVYRAVSVAVIDRKTLLLFVMSEAKKM